MKYIVTVNGKKYEVEVERVKQKYAPIPRHNPVTPAPQAAPEETPKAEHPVSSGDTTVKSPMPGTVVEVKVNVGDAVTEGQTLLILEAMKMENEIVSPVNGTVKQVAVAEGTTVDTHDVLVVIG